MKKSVFKDKLRSIEHLGYFALKHLLSFAAGFIISKASFNSTISPFSLSFLAITPDIPLSVLSYYIGSFFGFITKDFSIYNFKYIIANSIMYVIILILGADNYYKRAYTPILPGIVCFITGFIFLFADSFTVFSVILLICESMLCGCLSFFVKLVFQAVMRKNKFSYRDIISLNITLLIIICALDNYYIFGAPLSFIFVISLCCLSCYYLDGKITLLFNLTLCAVPAVLHLSSGNYFILLYLPSAVSVLISKYSKKHIAAAYLLTYVTVITFDISIVSLGIIISPLISAIIYLLLPKRKIADLICNYINISSNTEKTEENFEDICKNCNDALTSLLTELNSITITPILNSEKEHRLKRYLRTNRCKDVDITNYYNEYGKQIITVSCKTTGMFSVSSLKNKVSEICKNEFILSDISEDGQNIYCRFEQTDKYKVECYALYKPKNEENICGDTVSAFKSPGGKYNLILADGMGSGKEAYIKSTDTVTLLKKLLKNGINSEQATELVNSSIGMLKEEIGFSTIDLCSISLNDGKGEFIKCGAYKSYVLRNNKITTIGSGGFPAGLTDKIASVKTSWQFEDKDIIIMMSDGTVAADEKIQAVLLMNQCDNMEILTREIIDCAYRGTPKDMDDDMTIMTARIIKRNVE